MKAMKAMKLQKKKNDYYGPTLINFSKNDPSLGFLLQFFMHSFSKLSNFKLKKLPKSSNSGIWPKIGLKFKK